MAALNKIKQHASELATSAAHLWHDALEPELTRTERQGLLCRAQALTGEIGSQAEQVADLSSQTEELEGADQDRSRRAIKIVEAKDAALGAVSILLRVKDLSPHERHGLILGIQGAAERIGELAH